MTRHAISESEQLIECVCTPCTTTPTTNMTASPGLATQATAVEASDQPRVLCGGKILQNVLNLFIAYLS